MKTLFFLLAAAALLPAQRRFTSYVDPFIGTAAHGHVFPGAAVPFGMVQLSPDNGTEGWDWTSGYHWSDSTIKGFSHTHLSGTGVGDLCDILFMPAVLKRPGDRYAARFSHTDEKAEPGYYRVTFPATGITAELTATDRAGFHRYTFAKGKEASVVIDLGHRLNWDSPTESHINIEGKQLVTGYRFSRGWAPKQRIYFAARFDRPFRSVHLGNDSVMTSSGTTRTEKGVKAVLRFRTERNAPVLVKVGISAVSVEGAVKNLDAEIPGWSFDAVRASASDRWERALERVAVADTTAPVLRTFYTALYRTMLAPVTYSDVDGRYRGGDDSVHHADGFTNHTIFSLWDTYRAAHPLYTIVQPERVNDLVRSMLAFAREHGRLPVWTLHANETMCMIGYHAVPVIADAYLKGFRDYDAQEAFAAMQTSAMADHLGLRSYRQYGYIPTDHEVESVSKTLEYAYDDWCIARMAEETGNPGQAVPFYRRSQFYRNVFDTASRFMRGRTSAGAWREPFDPLAVDHRLNDYTEGNAWQYSWYVPHDVAGLIALHGGEEAFIRRLDSLFDQRTSLTGDNISPDISGLIGQYAHGNEPSHHIAYLYMYAGAPWKGQERLAAIMRTMYRDTPDGLSGNEDCGQMSAWYIFSALGFYPVNPADQRYVIGTPAVSGASLALPGGKRFTMRAEGLSPSHRFIAAVTLNGTPLARTYLQHSEIMNGGELVFRMTDRPAVWGSGPGDAPPSMSRQR